MTVQSQSKQGERDNRTERGIVVALTRAEAEQLWMHGSEARSIIAGFPPESRKRYESEAWFTGAQKLRAALDAKQEEGHA